MLFPYESGTWEKNGVACCNAPKMPGRKPGATEHPILRDNSVTVLWVFGSCDLL